MELEVLLLTSPYCFVPHTKGFIQVFVRLVCSSDTFDLRLLDGSVGLMVDCLRVSITQGSGSSQFVYRLCDWMLVSLSLHLLRFM